MKASCCRSLPRCATCPVVLAAAARRDRGLDASAALVTSILAGSPPSLPRCVEEALAQLERARSSAGETPRIAA